MQDSTARNKRIVREIYEVGFNRGDSGVFDRLYSDDFLHHDKTIHDVASGAAGEKQSMQRFREAIPDVLFTIESQIAEGDRVVVQLVIRGTPVRDFPPIVADGRSIEIRAVAIFRIEADRVAEEWFYREPAS